MKYLIKKTIWFFFAGLAFMPGALLAACASGFNVISVMTVPSAPLGSTIAVTVVYDQTGTWAQLYLLAAFNKTSTAIQACNSPNQTFVIYGASNGSASTTNPPAGDKGFQEPGGSATATTVVFNVTVPNTLTAGSTYNFVVGGSGCDAECSDLGNIESTNHTTVTVPAPAPGIANFSKTAEGNSANPGDLILFRMDYTYTNDGPVTITDVLPGNVTPTQANGAEISTGGTLAGNTATWVLPYTGGLNQGYVWVLTKVNTGVAAGTEITNTATIASADKTAPPASANVAVGGKFQLSKAESTASLNSGSNMTYTLSYAVGGTSLQTSDSYGNNTVGSSSMDGHTITGFDAVPYAAQGSGGQVDTWTLKNDPLEGNYIDVTTPNAGLMNTEGYETLLRNTPAAPFCGGGTYEVEGDIEIPATLSAAQGGGSTDNGQDATMVLAVNTANNVGFVLILSHDAFPGYLALQENDPVGGQWAGAYQAVATVTNPALFKSPAMQSGVLFSTWYTVKAQITNAGGNITVNAVVWPVGTTPPAAGVWDINYTTTTALSKIACGGANVYQYGWQANPSSEGAWPNTNYGYGRDYYANLRMFSDDAAIHTRIWDTLPTGMGYGGQNSSLTFAKTGNVLNWSFPVTVYDQPLTSLTWWGPVTCMGSSGPITNIASVMDDTTSPQAVTSNAVVANVICNTDTPTVTPTNTPTRTPTYTPTVTPTQTWTVTPTNTFTVTPTQTPTNTPTMTNTYTPTVSPTNTFTETYTRTPTNTPTVTNTYTQTVTPTETFTQTPTVTPTNTFTVTATYTVTATPTFTSPNTPTYTFTQTPTSTPTNTYTVTNTRTPTVTPTQTFTQTPTISPTDTYTVTDTKTPTQTPTQTFTPTMTQTPTETPTQTQTYTPTQTPTLFVEVDLTKNVSDVAPQSNESLTFNLKVSVPFNAASGVIITDTVPAGLTFTSVSQPSNPPGTVVTVTVPTPAPTGGTGTLLVWSFPSLPPGNYTFPYNATVNDFMPGGTAITNCAAWTYPPQVTVPNVSCAALTVQGNYTVRIGVFNEAGELVYSFPVTHYSEAIQNVNMSLNTLVSINDQVQLIFHGVVLGTWNGTNNGGTEVTNGKYYVKIDNIDPTGVVNTQTQPVLVARHLATLTVNIYNEAGELVRRLDQTVADAVTMNTGFSLSASTFSPGYKGGPNAVLTIGLSGGTTITWDGRGDNGEFLTNGQYTVDVNTYDGQGGNATVSKQVTIYHTSLDLPNGNVKVYPNPYSVKADGGAPVTFSVGGNYSLTANIYTVAGELVAQVGSFAGNNYATWDPTSQMLGESYSVASGLYLAVVVVKDTQGATQRTTHKIAIIR